MNTLSRRNLLGAIGATSMATTVQTSSLVRSTAAPHPDAALLELCDRFSELEQRLDAMGHAVPGTPADDAEEREEDAIFTAQNAILQQMQMLPTRTRDGLHARARIVFIVDSHLHDADSMAGALIRDLLREEALRG